jgi:type IV pilus assembly protein PilN
MRQRTQLNFAQRWTDQLLKPKRVAAKKRRRILLAVIAVLFLIILGSLPWVYEYQLNKDLAMINQQVEELKELDNQVIQLRHLEEEVRKQAAILDTINGNKKDPGKMLAQLRNYLPQSAVVNSFAIDANKTMTVSITLRTPMDVTKLWSDINESELFEPIEIDVISLLDLEQTLDLTLRFR